MDVRVGTSVSHGQEEGLGVLELEVLVGKLLAIDGLATRALVYVSSVSCRHADLVLCGGKVLTLPRVKSPP
jgi:hypothetical protein